MLRPGLFALATLAAAPAPAAVLFTQTVTALGGVAELDDSSVLDHFLGTSSTWVGVSGGQLTSGSWEVFGSVTISWWDPVGGGFDENDEPVPALAGNDYFYVPSCTATAGAPSTCGTGPLQAGLAANLFRVDFDAPENSNICTPTFQGSNANCAFSYSFSTVAYNFVASATGDVTFSFYDSDPSLVPEPATWGLMLAGFGLTGLALRRRGLVAA